MSKDGHVWREPDVTGNQRMTIHGRNFYVDALAIIRHAGRVTFVLEGDVVRALGEQGELELSTAQRARIYDGFRREGLIP